LRIGDRIETWEEGRSLIFDDTFEHEAWNDSDDLRVVLFVDLLRPLHFPASAVNRSLVSIVKRTGYVQDSRRNHEEWERRFAGIVRGRIGRNGIVRQERSPGP
jgi:beta-hydroxylase